MVNNTVEMSVQVHLLLILLAFRVSKSCSNDNRLIFDQYYNEAIAPTKPTTKVEIGLYFKNFEDVNDSQKTFTFNSVIKLKWQDDRIRMDPNFNQLRKLRTFATCIWSPHVMFRGQVSLSHVDNAVKDTDILIENIANTSIQIDFSLHVIVKINCPYFDFVWFPFDRQFCSVILGTRDTNVVLDGEVLDTATFNIQYAPLEYDVTNTSLGSRDTVLLKEKGKSYIGTRLFFDRKLPPYYGYLIFSETIVCISWITILGYFHILLTIHKLKAEVFSDGMDPKVIEEQRVHKINRFYLITSPILNSCMWLCIGSYAIWFNSVVV